MPPKSPPFNPATTFSSAAKIHGWPHSRECLRVSFSMDEVTVPEGLAIIAEVVEMAFREKS